jgi:hypothetical protein
MASGMDKLSHNQFIKCLHDLRKEIPQYAEVIDNLIKVLESAQQERRCAHLDMHRKKLSNPR